MCKSNEGHLLPVEIVGKTEIAQLQDRRQPLPNRVTSELSVTRGATRKTRLATAASSTRRGQNDQIKVRRNET